MRETFAHSHLLLHHHNFPVLESAAVASLLAGLRCSAVDPEPNYQVRNRGDRYSGGDAEADQEN